MVSDKGKVNKKPGSRSSTSSSSRSSTPTKATENQSATSTVQAVAKRLEGRPGTPSKCQNNFQVIILVEC